MTTPYSPIDLLYRRRSVMANDLCEPGPDKDQIEMILRAAHRVPDHGKIGPWRFILFTGDARRDFGNVLADIARKNNPEITEKLLNFEQERFTRAPLVIAVISSVDAEHPKIPRWEQELSVGAACQNILLAASALDFGAQWLTEWYTYDETVHDALGLKANEKPAGFIYIGRFLNKPDERVRPDLLERISYWKL